MIFKVDNCTDIDSRLSLGKFPLSSGTLKIVLDGRGCSGYGTGGSTIFEDWHCVKVLFPDEEH